MNLAHQYSGASSWPLGHSFSIKLGSGIGNCSVRTHCPIANSKCGWRRGFGRPDVDYFREKRNGAGDAGACEPDAEPTYKAPPAVSGYGDG